MVATYHNDKARTGVNSAETRLSPANVNVMSFGRRAAVPVQGDVYAQPLYVNNVPVNGALHNLVIVATEHDQAYGIDADTGTVVWHRDFLVSSSGTVTPIPSDDLACGDLIPEVGITGTPVMDLTTQTIYLVVRTKETQGDQVQYYQRLHALELTSGQDRLAPTVIVSPNDPNGKFGVARFDPLLNHQHPALLLNQGKVYVSWASHCDLGNYQGWLMSFDKTTLQPVGAWTPSPGGQLGGIWLSGGGPATDGAGDIYLATANGWTDVMTGGSNYGDSVVRLHDTGQEISASDYFTPYDYTHLFYDDVDLGSGGPVILPTQLGAQHPNLLVAGGKEGTTYLLDRDNLGQWHDGDDSQILQSFSSGGGWFSTPAFWNNTLYVSVPNQPVQAFSYDPVAQLFNPIPASTSGAITLGFPGSSPVLSANGSSNAIVWILQRTHANAILRAFNAADLGIELYNSDVMSDRDHAGAAIKFATPTVADGKVFVGSHNELDIYGLL